MKSKGSLGKIVKEKQELGIKLKTKPERKSYPKYENIEKCTGRYGVEKRT